MLNPMMSLIFSAAFLGLWRYQRNQRYLLMLAASYLVGAAGFILQVYHFPLDLFWTRGSSSSLFLIAAATTCIALCWRYERAPPYLAFAVIAAAGLAAFLWFWFGQENITNRVYAINFAIGAMILITAREVSLSTRRAQIDRVLLAMLTLQGVLFFVRTIATVNPGEMHTEPGLNATFYWLIFTFSHSLLSVASVFILVTGAVLDVVGGLRNESKTDAMTGLWNRRGFDLKARAALAERAHHVPITMIVGDLDHFKRINDNFGHHAGDAVIVSFAGVIRDVVGDLHPAGRLGGEEFAILVVGGDHRVAELMAQGVRIGFSLAKPPAALGREAKLTASFGVAQWRKGEPYEALMERADAALYAAKNAGRDCVRVDGRPEAEALSHLA